MATKLKTYPGKDVDITWDGTLCIHVGECGRANNDLFVGGRNPWCQPAEVGTTEAVEVVLRCPTGALTYTPKDGAAAERPAAENTVVVANHGPLYVRGDLEIQGASDERPGVRTRAALCRCGASNNKPFCDNSHEESGFQDRGAVGATGPGLSSTGGKLTINRAKNGPLLLEGNFTIISSSGSRTFAGDKAALCRCGQSKNKPFCDGAHKAAGFSAA